MLSRPTRSEPLQLAPRVVDDLKRDDLVATVGTRWQLVTDRVMGGVSEGTLAREIVDGRPALRMQGDVSLENNGGFVQIALDLTPQENLLDASGWAGIELDVIGNDEDYALHIRTDAVVRPWQSYRQRFRAGTHWRTVQLPFTEFLAHRIDIPLDARRLRRIGLVAIGRSFTADLGMGGVRFFA